MNALSLTERDLVPHYPIEIVSTGHPKVIIPLKSQSILHEINPNLSALTALSAEINCNGYFLFTLDSDDPKILTHARMFAPAIGINEDPVTGMGHGPLGAYLITYGLVDYNDSQFNFISRQGEAMRRPGEVQVSVQMLNRKPHLVKVRGTAVMVFKTTIEI